MNTKTTTNQTSTSDASLGGARRWFGAHGLARPRQGRLLGGVCAGLARRYGVNLLVMRVLAVTTALFLTPLIYVALWVLMPRES
jgi:phage shock protein PspC (stress-responsive transcriptional regulator)